MPTGGSSNTSNTGPNQQQQHGFQTSFALPRVLYSDEKENAGPELLLTRVEEFLSTRDDSPSLRRQQQQQQRTGGSQRGTTLGSREPKVSSISEQQQQYSIPVEEIMAVDTKQNRSLLITTLSMGVFEFYDLTANGYDILLAFLKASLHPERIAALEESFSSCYDTLHSNSSVTSCLDVDTLQARHLSDRAENETWPEKLSRRVGHVLSSLSELSDAFCAVSCCNEKRDAAPAPSSAAAAAGKPSTTITTTPTKKPELEIDDASTVQSPQNNKKTKPPVQMRSGGGRRPATSSGRRPPIASIPSGLSVEPDPEMDTSSRL
jgi:hypothetical protein